MNKNLRSLLITTSLCLTLVVTSIACDKHNSDNAENNKKFDYSKVTKNLSESVRKEVDDYYSKIDSEYDKLSGEAKKAVAKISQYKKNTFTKKVKNAKKKNSNS